MPIWRGTKADRIFWRRLPECLSSIWKKKEAELRDLEIINRHAEALNDEAEDVLGFQASI